MSEFDEAEEVPAGDEMPDPERPRLRQRWQYKVRQNRLDMDDPTLLTRIARCAMEGLTKTAAAAVLGVGRDYLYEFFEKHPIALEAWKDGRALREVQVRQRLNIHALSDPATARFVAKHILPEFKEKKQPAPGVGDQPAAPAARLRREEAIRRVTELMAKLLPSPTTVAPSPSITPGRQVKASIR